MACRSAAAIRRRSAISRAWRSTTSSFAASASMLWARRLRRASRDWVGLVSRGTTPFSLTALTGFPQLFLGNEIEQIQSETPQNRIRLGERELALALQDMMKMRLRKSGGISQASFGRLAVPDAAAQILHQTCE